MISCGNDTPDTNRAWFSFRVLGLLGRDGRLEGVLLDLVEGVIG